MVDTVPKWLIQAAVVSISALTFIFIISVESLSPKSDLELTILEWKNYDNDRSKIDLIIKNVGTLSANNIIVVLEPDSNYILKNFNSTESIPLENKTPKNFRIEIDRLSPSSFSIINLEGDYNVNPKKISLFSDGDPKFLNILDSERSFGATTIDIVENISGVVQVLIVIGIFSIVSTHYFLTYYKESFRKHYLDSYDIEHVSYDVYRVIWGLIVLSAFVGLSVGLGYYTSTTYYMNYGIDKLNHFVLNEQIKPDVFFVVPPSSTVIVLMMFVGIIISIVVSSPRMYLPRFYWFLKPKTVDHVTLLQIHNSWLKPNEYNLFANVKYDGKKKEIFTVTNGTKIIGLLSTKEIKIVTESGKQTFQEIFLDSSIEKPPFVKEKIKRENFCEILQDETLSNLKDKMENSRCRFAVIRNNDNKIVGIADYDLIF
ncbi:hypothetical protein [Nitrosopumilus sp.]|uniref:hypothetical protein n=1 Tax=Nitrosopumilus sp. TaxID=2024843 RepID=UPI003D10DF59